MFKLTTGSHTHTHTHGDGASTKQSWLRHAQHTKFSENFMAYWAK